MTCFRRLASVVLVLSSLALFVNSTSAAAFKRVHEGDDAPAFILPSVNGETVNFKAFHDGPLTVVTFWALWNDKSEPLLKDIQALLQEFGGKGVKALAINAEGQSPPAGLDGQIQEFARKAGVSFPMLVDRKLEQYENWGVIALPATAFVAKDGKIVYEFSGHPTSTSVDMREHALEALGIKEQIEETKKPKRERYRPTAKSVGLNFGLARTLFERGQFDQAAAKVEKVLAEDPNFPDAHALSGVIHLALEKLGRAENAAKAREEFGKSLELDPHVPLGLAGTAYFAWKDGDLPKSLEHAKRAAEFTETAEEKPRERVRPEGTTKVGNLDEAAPKEHARPVMKEERVKLHDVAPDTQKEEQKEEQKEVSKEPAPAPRVDVPGTLAEAEKALAANDAKTTGETLEKAISALLGIPQGPKLKKSGLVERVRKQQP